MNRIFLNVSRAARHYTKNWKDVRCFGSLHDRVLTEVDSKTGICKMRLNSPPVNILDGDMLDALSKAVKNAESSKDVRGIIVTSNFDGKVFSAGLNIMDMYQKPHNHIVEYWTLVQEWYLSLYGCSKPTVAVINGHALAGGCALALLCDYRVMQSGARRIIGLTESRIGIAVPFFLLDLVTSVLNKRPAELILLQGLVFEAEEALKVGYVDDIDTLDNLMVKGEKQLESFMSIPPKAYHLTKYLIRKKSIAKLLEIRKDDAKHFADQVCHPLVQDRIGAYLAELKSKS